MGNADFADCGATPYAPLIRASSQLSEVANEVTLSVRANLSHSKPDLCKDIHAEAFVTLDKEQGWVAQRTTRTWTISSRQRKRFWGGRFTTVIETQRVRSRRDRADLIERVFHLTTHPVTAAQAAGLIRGHWGIENRWHHLRDVGFKEDACQATGRTAAYLGLVAHVDHQSGSRARREPQRGLSGAHAGLACAGRVVCFVNILVQVWRELVLFRGFVSSSKPSLF